MDVEQCRVWIQQLSVWAERVPSQPEADAQAVLETQRDRYLSLHTGWRGSRRTHGCSLHLDIKDGKIWIQHDGTEIGIATQLLELGVPPSDIVLAFHLPSMRKLQSLLLTSDSVRVLSLSEWGLVFAEEAIKPVKLVQQHLAT